MYNGNETTSQLLAIFLHDTQCGYNHTDGCGWYYEYSGIYKNRTWESSEHKSWLHKANIIIKKLGVNNTIVLNVLRKRLVKYLNAKINVNHYMKELNNLIEG
jgi:hypothetical protein